MVNSVDDCVEKLKLGDIEDIDDQQRFCLNGCLLKKLNLVLKKRSFSFKFLNNKFSSIRFYFQIGDDGKLLANGIDDFFKTVPEQYTNDYPELRKQLTEIAPQLREAKNACDAGQIADPAVGDLFKTEYAE